jgi:hypothetical protein
MTPLERTKETIVEQTDDSDWRLLSDVHTLLLQLLQYEHRAEDNEWLMSITNQVAEQLEFNTFH